MEHEFLWLSIIYNYMRCHPKPIAEVIFFKMVIAPPTSDNCMGWWLWMTAWHFYQYLPYRKKCVHYTDWIWLYLFCLIVDAQQKARDSHRGSGPRWLKQRDSNVPWMRVKEHVFFSTQYKSDLTWGNTFDMGQGSQSNHSTLHSRIGWFSVLSKRQGYTTSQTFDSTCGMVTLRPEGQELSMSELGELMLLFGLVLCHGQNI